MLTMSLPEGKPKDQGRGRSRSKAPQQGSRQQREQAKRIWDWCQVTPVMLSYLLASKHCKSAGSLIPRSSCPGVA